VTAPSYQDQPITLRVLASHRSGLPRMPSNFIPAKSNNPYIDYTEKELYEYISGFKLLQEIGSRYEYSNLGYLLLGRLLEQAYGKPYETLVTGIITGPLGMPDTRIALSEDQKARFAQAHTDVYPTSAWDFALPGAGALRSTTADMLRFLAANLAPDQSQLGDAMRLIRQECYETDTYFIQVCLGIHTYFRYGKQIYQHDGQTGGYHSFAGFLPEEGTAVIVLVNSNYDIDALGLHLLDPRVPLPGLE
jgi:CubicO group peptidase (beta-lactamase class C family)